MVRRRGDADDIVVGGDSVSTSAACINRLTTSRLVTADATSHARVTGGMAVNHCSRSILNERSELASTGWCAVTTMAERAAVEVHIRSRDACCHPTKPNAKARTSHCQQHHEHPPPTRVAERDPRAAHGRAGGARPAQGHYRAM